MREITHIDVGCKLKNMNGKNMYYDGGLKSVT